MVTIGKRNQLKVLKSAPPGYYLDGGPLGELLLPGALIPEGSKVGDTLDVFLYRDSEDRLVTTTEIPHAEVGEFAYLRVVSVAPRIGVFLDWGLSKDLLLPIRELKAGGVQQGDWIVVYVMLDTKTDRIVASARINRHYSLEEPVYGEGQLVSLLITGESPLGYNAIVENKHRGLLYHSDTSSPLGTGQKVDGYVRTVREDHKIDLSLDRAGFQRIGSNTDKVLEVLIAAGGRAPFHDNSSPEEIRAAFGLSKKAFKQAIGSLFKERRIVIAEHGIRLADGFATPVPKAAQKEPAKPVSVPKPVVADGDEHGAPRFEPSVQRSSGQRFEQRSAQRSDQRSDYQGGQGGGKYSGGSSRSFSHQPAPARAPSQPVKPATFGQDKPKVRPPTTMQPRSPFGGNSGGKSGGNNSGGGNSAPSSDLFPL